MRFLAFALVFCCVLALGPDKASLLNDANKIVEYPMPVYVRVREEYSSKYTKGIELTYEQLYNVEMKCDILFSGESWNLYDFERNWVAELAPEYVRFLNLKEMETSARPILEIFDDQEREVLDDPDIVFPSYKEYIELVFSDDYVGVHYGERSPQN